MVDFLFALVDAVAIIYALELARRVSVAVRHSEWSSMGDGFKAAFKPAGPEKVSFEVFCTISISRIMYLAASQFRFWTVVSALAGCFLYIVFHFMFLRLKSPVQDIGPGLAKAFFSYMENCLDGTLAKHVEIYCHENDLGRNAKFASVKNVVLLFPSTADLLALRNCQGTSITSKIVHHDEDYRKGDKDRNGYLYHAKEMTYVYFISGSKRTCSFDVLRWTTLQPSGCKQFNYVAVFDNRGLQSILDWCYFKYEGSKPEVKVRDLNMEVQRYKRSIISHLNKNPTCKAHCHVFEYEGALSNSLGRLCDELATKDNV